MGSKATSRAEKPNADGDKAATWNRAPGVRAGTNAPADRWEIEFAVTKRHVGETPVHSAEPAGPSYHWHVFAQQGAAEPDTNERPTNTTGMKFKVADERAGAGKWSATPQAQRRHLINLLQRVVDDLEREALRGEHAEEGASSVDGGTPARNGTTPEQTHATRSRARAKKSSATKTSRAA